MCRFACCSKGADNAPPAKYGMAPNSERKCRDTLCCLLFVLFWVGMVVIAGIAFDKGHPSRLLYGTDYRGETCGVGDLKSRKYITYPRTAEDYLINLGKSPKDMKFYGICVSSCPNQYDVICNDEEDIQTEITTQPSVYSQENMLQCLNGTSPAVIDCTLVGKRCWVTAIDTESTFYHCLPVKDYEQNVTSACIFPSTVSSSSSPFCIVAQVSTQGSVEEPAHENAVFSALTTVARTWSRYFGDLQRTWYVVTICGILLAMAISIIWLFFMKACTGVMVFLALTFTVFICIALTLFCYFKAGILSSDAVVEFSEKAGSQYSTKISQSLTESETNKNRFKVAAYVFTGVTVVVICIVVALRRAIFTAINVIKLGVRAITNVPGTVFYPIFTVALIFALLVWWIFVAASMVSAGKITVSDFTYNSTFSSVLPSINENMTSIDDNNVLRYFLIYHFFGLLWTNQFIQGLGMCTIAGAVCGWYFSVDEARNNLPPELKYTQPRFPVFSALWRTFRYSLGSIAFGALLIAIIQAIRAALAYFQRNSERFNKASRIAKAIFCCIQCCLKCLQSLIELVTRNAYIYISIKGTSFCTAGRKVFSIMMANTITLAIVNYLAEVITFLGKILVSAASGFACFWYVERTAKFQSGGSDEVSSSWFPVIVSMLFGYCVASGFFYVYDIAVDAMLICFILDCEENVERGGKKVPIHFQSDLITSLKAKEDEPVAGAPAPAADADAAPTGKINPAASPPHASGGYGGAGGDAGGGYGGYGGEGQRAPARVPPTY